MAYDHAVFQVLTSYEVPRKIALALADDNSPLALKSTVGAKVTAQTAPAALAGGADLATTVTKVNAIITALTTAGVFQ